MLGERISRGIKGLFVILISSACAERSGLEYQVFKIDKQFSSALYSFIGQRWKIGQFEMEVMEVRGHDGTYSGLAAVIIPYLGFRVYGTFNDIKVNENREVIVGEVKALSEGVEEFKKRFAKEAPVVQIDPSSTASTGSNGAPVLFDGVDVKVDMDVESVTVDDQGTIVVADAKGQKKEITPTKGKDTRITDKNGDQWIVNKDGNVSKVPAQSPNSAAPSSQPKQIDVTKLDDFEKLVKGAIDSLYKANADERDTLTKVKDAEQKELDKAADAVDSFEAGIANDDETESDFNFPETLTKIETLDSLIENKKITIKKINDKLDKLNGYLDDVSSISKDVKTSVNFDQITALPERRKKIYEYVENKLKK